MASKTTLQSPWAFRGLVPKSRCPKATPTVKYSHLFRVVIMNFESSLLLGTIRSDKTVRAAGVAFRHSVGRSLTFLCFLHNITYENVHSQYGYRNQRPGRHRI